MATFHIIKLSISTPPNLRFEESLEHVGTRRSLTEQTGLKKNPVMAHPTPQQQHNEHYCLKWNNYQTNIVQALSNLKLDEDFVDVTLLCEGKTIKAHKVILSACSDYFRDVFRVSLITVQDLAVPSYWNGALQSANLNAND